MYETLSHAIVEGEIPPGWRLAEERLAGIFGVSRTPIREALTRLATSGLVTRDERGTVRVELIAKDKILDVYAVRVDLEALAARLAAQIATPILVLELEHINDAYARLADPPDLKRMAELSLAFHTAIARASRNEMLVSFVEQINVWVRRIPSTTLAQPGRIAVSIEQHRALIEAIRGHRPEEAEAVARKHMQEAEAIRVAMLAGIS